MDGSDLQPLPGVREWLEKLRAASGTCAVGSSTPLENINAAMAKIKLRPFFDAIITAEDVTLGKPNPEVFLKAAAPSTAAQATVQYLKMPLRGSKPPELAA